MFGVESKVFGLDGKVFLHVVLEYGIFPTFLRPIEELFMLVLVRPGPEINLKSDRIRAKFLRKLRGNIESALNKAGVEFTITMKWSRIFVEINDSHKGLEALQRVFGVSSLSPVEHIAEPTMESMEAAISKYKEMVAGKKFCVRVKRYQVPGFKSFELERGLGGILYPHSAGVDLTEPEVKVEVAMTKEGVFFSSQRLAGPGGLPLGVEGKALCLISGGFDSAVAAYLMMKRGVACDFLFCNLAGGSYERSVLGVTKGLVSNWSYGYKPKIHILDFAPVIKNIKSTVRGGYAQLILKRAMYKAANAVAANSEDCIGLITGEAVGQVSSQTLKNLGAINDASELIVFRPLVSFDKEEIIRLSRKIGTYDLCAPIKEYCSIESRKPVTGSNPQKAKKEQDRLDLALIDKSVEQAKVLNIWDLDSRILSEEYCSISTIIKGAVVLDCRTRAEYEEWHYPGSLHLEYETLVKAYSKFDKAKSYVLYCPWGLQTAVIAEKMQDSGYEAYSFKGGVPSLMKYAKTLDS